MRRNILGRVTTSGPTAADPTAADLEDDPHPHLARLREHEPAAWIPALGGRRPGLCLDPDLPARPRGPVSGEPPRLDVRWDR